MDFTNHLAYIDKRIFENFEKKELNLSVVKEKRWTEPKYKTEYFMPELTNDPESQGKLGITYLCNEVNADSYETF